MPTPYRHALITAFGTSSTNVEVVNSVLADPTSKQIQVQVLYSGFSGADINMRLGTYPLQKKSPLIPGYCLIGRITSLGPDCDSSKHQVGDTIASLTVYNAEATYANIPEKYCIRVPNTVTNLEAATALILDWNTAYGMVHRAAKIQQDDKVFIHGLSGAVGQALVSLCKLQGAKVYGTASQRNHEALITQGVTPFVYTDKNWITKMKEIGGVYACFDALGFESWDESYEICDSSWKGRGSILVGYGGNLATYQSTDGGKVSSRSVVLPTAKLLARNLAFCARRTTFFYIDRDQKTFRPELDALFKLLGDGKIQVSVKRVFSLDEVPKIHEEWNKIEGMGSVVVKIQP